MIKKTDFSFKPSVHRGFNEVTYFDEFSGKFSATLPTCLTDPVWLEDDPTQQDMEDLKYAIIPVVPSEDMYESYLNELPVPEPDKQSNGGRIPDHCMYGTWLRKNDKIAWNVGYREWAE